jgi:hypothetical protein
MLPSPPGTQVTDNITISNFQLDQSHFVFEKLRSLLSVILNVSERSMLSQKKYLSCQQVVSVLAGKKAMMRVRYVNC